MARLLVVYGTTEGYTRKIATRISEWLTEAGHGAVVLDAAAALPGLLDENEYDAVIVCGSVHQGKHSSALTQVVLDNLSDFNRVPTAFVSVSLSAAMAEPKYRAEARSYVDEFLRETGWRPTHTITVAGALRYTSYDFMKRLMAQLIARSRNVDADPSRDWEFTDWDELREFVLGFVGRVQDTTRVGR